MEPSKEMQEVTELIKELQNKQRPTVEDPVPLYTWWMENTIKDTMLWKEAARNQMHFVDDLNGFFVLPAIDVTGHFRLDACL
jgi:hypothetical protein